MERNYSKAEEILQSAEEIANKRNVLAKAQARNEPFRHGVELEKLGRIARFRGEQEKARENFAAARPFFEEWLAKNPGDNSWWGSHAPAYIAEIDAALGRKEDAIREGRNIAELWPLQRDALIGSDIQIILAIVYMWSGERDAALQQLMEVAKVPVMPPSANFFPGFSAGELKLNPIWDELRNDPRFDKIIAEAAKPVKID
jgi:tetratricopeptide (TPR) repeat protein